MSFVRRSVLAPALVLALGAVCSGSVGCRDEAASNAASATALAAAEAQSARQQATQVNIDPIVTKTYRTEACYYGTLTFHQARNAYLASLKGGEPSSDKLPEFGAVIDEPASGRNPVPPVASGAPATSSSAKVVVQPKASASAKPAGSAAPAPSGSAMGKTKPTIDPSKKIRQVRYEYFARMCKTAAGIKAPGAPDLDALLGEYSVFAMNLAKDLSDANTYYQRETYKEDNFAKGKEFHAKLVEEFKKVDDYEKKLSDALTRFKSDNPIDRSGWTESRNLADAVVVATRELYLDVDAATVDIAKAKADLAKLDAAIDTLKKYGTDHKEQQDPYAQIVSPAGERAAKHGHEVLDAEGFKTPAPHQVVALATFFEQVLDGNYRALIKQLRTESGGAPGFSDKLQHPRMPGGRPIVPQRVEPQQQQ